MLPMSRGQWLLTHLADIAKWVQTKRDYAFNHFAVDVDDSTPLDDLDSEIIYKGKMVIPEYRDENGTFFIDLRLQYNNGEIILHSGGADYDQNHRGNWASSAVEWCATDDKCADIALDLLEDLFNEIPE